MKAAISALEDNNIPPESQGSVDETADEALDEPPKVKPKPGQIGEGKPTPLSKAQRKRALYVFVLLCYRTAHFTVHF